MPATDLLAGVSTAPPLHVWPQLQALSENEARQRRAQCCSRQQTMTYRTRTKRLLVCATEDSGDKSSSADKHIQQLLQSVGQQPSIGSEYGEVKSAFLATFITSAELFRVLLCWAPPAACGSQPAGISCSDKAADSSLHTVHIYFKATCLAAAARNSKHIVLAEHSLEPHCYAW